VKSEPIRDCDRIPLGPQRANLLYGAHLSGCARLSPTNVNLSSKFNRFNATAGVGRGGVFGVATKHVSKPKVNSGSNWEQATFVQRDLTADEQQSCKNWEHGEGECLAELDVLAQDGYKVTFRWDEYNKCQGCWLLPPKDHPDNAGLILTGRGSVAWKALKQALFKHYVIFQEVWQTEAEHGSTRDIDD